MEEQVARRIERKVEQAFAQIGQHLDVSRRTPTQNRRVTTRPDLGGRRELGAQFAQGIQYLVGVEHRRKGQGDDIGLMRIQQEAGIAAGVRRIEAQTGHGALELVRGQEGLLKEAATALKTEPERILDAISKLRDQRRDAERRAVSAEEKLQAHAAEALKSQAVDVGGVKVLAARLTGDLRAAAEALRNELGSSVVVLASEQGGKAVLVVGVSKDLTSRVHAGKIVEQSAPAVGGRGGGRPDLAQAGGDNPAGIDAALAKALELIRAQLGA